MIPPRLVTLASGHTIAVRSPEIPLVRHYAVVTWADTAAPSASDVDEMWRVAHATARALGRDAFGDPECFTVLYNGARTRRKGWPHFHVIPARSPAEQRWVLCLLFAKRALRVLRRAWCALAGAPS